MVEQDVNDDEPLVNDNETMVQLLIIILDDDEVEKIQPVQLELVIVEVLDEVEFVSDTTRLVLVDVSV